MVATLKSTCPISFLLKCDLKGLQFVLWPSYNLKIYIPIPQNHLTFDQILQQAELPNPGPEYYEARRHLWLTPRMAPSPQGLSSAREKLEEILSRPNAVHSINLWNNGLERVWKGLSSGKNLKSRLPMALVVRILKSLSVQAITNSLDPQDQDHTGFLAARQNMASRYASSEFGG